MSIHAATRPTSPALFRPERSPNDPRNTSSWIRSAFSSIGGVPYSEAPHYEVPEDGTQCVPPDYGLKRLPNGPGTVLKDDIAKRLLKTIKECVTDPDTEVEFDEDGDLAVPFLSALVIVTFFGEPTHIRFCAPLLREIDERESVRVCARLNELNGKEPLTRFVMSDGAIVAIADICAFPFVSEHVSKTFLRFCEFAASRDSLLQAEFGGQTAMGGIQQSLTRN